jgi:hypothetical protein
LHTEPDGKHGFEAAVALFDRPKQASAMPARPTPNFFSACRRVADWANPLASSSNLLFILFLSLCCLFYVLGQKKPLKGVLNGSLLPRLKETWWLVMHQAVRLGVRQRQRYSNASHW